MALTLAPEVFVSSPPPLPPPVSAKSSNKLTKYDSEVQPPSKMLKPKVITNSTIHQAAGRTIPSFTWGVLILLKLCGAPEN